MLVRWENKSEVLPGAEAVKAFIEKLHGQYGGNPIMADIYLSDDESGASLSIGLGHPGRFSLLTWVGADKDPPYYSSCGDPNAEGTVEFSYMTDWSEFPMWMVIDLASALQAVHEFCETGKLPETVSWQED